MDPMLDADAATGDAHSTNRELGYLDGVRPMSTGSEKSATSGGTVYYTPRNSTMSTGGTGGGRHGPSPLRPRDDSLPPPTYEAALQPPPLAHTPGDVDILDMPVPRPASPFATVSSTNGNSQPSAGSPPGLAMPDIAVWRNSSATGSNSGNASGEITIDVLEEAPPAAGENWSVMRRTGANTSERRTTFGGVSILLLNGFVTLLIMNLY
jgi:hypothetical protein